VQHRAGGPYPKLLYMNQCAWEIHLPMALPISARILRSGRGKGGYRMLLVGSNRYSGSELSGFHTKAERVPTIAHGKRTSPANCRTANQTSRSLGPSKWVFCTEVARTAISFAEASLNCLYEWEDEGSHVLEAFYCAPRIKRQERKICVSTYTQSLYPSYANDNPRTPCMHVIGPELHPIHHL